MKKTVKGLLVISAVVSGFLTAQTALAEPEIVMEEIAGIVTAVTLCTESDDCASMEVELCTIAANGSGAKAKTFIACTGETVTMYGLGPVDYWENYVVDADLGIIGVAYPAVGDYVTVAADYRDCEERYVAYSMDICDVDNNEDLVNCQTIVLRDEDGDVLWNQ
ncbi:MAG: hypothetical protein M0P70_05120 [Desulfobulbaceae bacterium]|nr:hypothetical protein [Desulfobulbaceae bacterium]